MTYEVHRVEIDFSSIDRRNKDRIDESRGILFESDDHQFDLDSEEMVYSTNLDHSISMKYRRFV